MGAPSRFFKGCPQGPPSVDSGLAEIAAYSRPYRAGDAQWYARASADGNAVPGYVIQRISIRKSLILNKNPFVTYGLLLGQSLLRVNTRPIRRRLPVPRTPMTIRRIAYFSVPRVNVWRIVFLCIGVPPSYNRQTSHLTLTYLVDHFHSGLRAARRWVQVHPALPLNWRLESTHSLRENFL